METYKVLLVDDEFLALQLLENFVQQVPNFELVDKVKNPLQAIEIINNQKIDILFLDIQMPTLSGVNLLKTLKYKPTTIFTTAYSEYALEAFDLDAVDYLLKPFSFERFLQAVNKAKAQIQPKVATQVSSASSDNIDFLVVKADAKTIKVPFSEILYIEGLKEYVRIVTKTQKIVTLERLKNMELALPTSSFMRVHKSYIVSTKDVQSIEGNLLEIHSHQIPVSRTHKAAVVKAIFG